RADHIKGFNVFKDTGQGPVVGQTVESTAIKKDETEFPIELSFSVVIVEGKWSAIGIIRDITERKHLEEALMKRSRTASLGAEIGNALTSVDTMHKILNSCAEAFVKYLGVDFARIWTLNEDENMLELQASAGMSTHIDGAHSRIPVGSLKIGKIAEEGKPYLTNNVIDDPWIIDKDWVRREGMIAFAGYPLLVDGHLVGVLAMFARELLTEDTLDALAPLTDEIALGIRRKIGETVVKQSLEKLKMTVDGIIDALALTVEQRDPYTAGHQKRVSKLACAIAGKMGMPKDQVDGLRTAGVLHEIGKRHIPAEILSRPGKLTDDELNIVKTHAQVSYDILKGIEFPWPVADIVHQHHEHMDGSGYPLGLTDGDILVEAKILCVSDVVEAMASHRPYRPALGMDKALEKIASGKGVCYDSDVVDACVKVVKEKGFQFEGW
ncbi:MAG: HD domain-containing phosphohydrolase, partial [Planctomycetota bacterium]